MKKLTCMNGCTDNAFHRYFSTVWDEFVKFKELCTPEKGIYYCDQCGYQAQLTIEDDNEAEDTSPNRETAVQEELPVLQDATTVDGGLQEASPST